jgi:hypothetical protein
MTSGAAAPSLVALTTRYAIGKKRIAECIHDNYLNVLVVDIKMVP